jgi:gamma-glutamyltranspeptidase/glutathione hydrolase
MKAKGGAVAAGDPYVARAAKEILQAGGNAYDAAVAAGWASFVAEQALTSAGGGGFLLGVGGKQQPVLYDFFVQTPLHRHPQAEEAPDPDFFGVEIDFGSTRQTFHCGMASMTVPGCIQGLFTVAAERCTMPMAELMTPAVQLAKEGVPLSSFQYELFKLIAPALIALPEGKKLYTINNELPKQGDLLCNPELASFLKFLAAEGTAEFYKGEIAATVAAECTKRGGLLTRADFEQYKVVKRHPLKLNLPYGTCYSNPLPSAGGSLAALALALQAELPVPKQWYSKQNLQQWVAVFKQVQEVRKTGGNNFTTAMENAFRPNALQKLAEQIKTDSFLGTTTHLSVADKLGNVVLMTTSQGQGSGYVAPGTGVSFNNMLGEADLNPNGFFNWPVNTRVGSMMAPTALQLNNGSWFGTGTGGANRIRSTLAEVIYGVGALQLPPEEAILLGRLHLEGKELFLEGAWPAEAYDKGVLQSALEVTPFAEERAFFFGGTHSVSIDNKDQVNAHADLRRNGAAEVV